MKSKSLQPGTCTLHMRGFQNKPRSGHICSSPRTEWSISPSSCPSHHIQRQNGVPDSGQKAHRSSYCNGHIQQSLVKYIFPVQRTSPGLSWTFSLNDFMPYELLSSAIMFSYHSCYIYYSFLWASNI